MRTTVSISGLKELDEALGQLSKATARGVLRRVGLKALQPVADTARALAPVDEGALRDSIGVGTKLTRRQAALHRKAVRSGESEKSFWEGFAGAGGLPQAITQEFGTVNHGPQPFLRPAYDANKDRMLETIKRDLGDEIQKAAVRQARKAARLAAKG